MQMVNSTKQEDMRIWHICPISRRRRPHVVPHCSSQLRGQVAGRLHLHRSPRLLHLIFPKHAANHQFVPATARWSTTMQRAAARTTRSMAAQRRSEAGADHDEEQGHVVEAMTTPGCQPSGMSPSLS
ncbi:hypothetical protein ACQJBY_024755 [Aegilops geniculata]